MKKTPKQSFDQNDQEKKASAEKKIVDQAVTLQGFKSPMQKLLQNLKPSDIIDNYDGGSDGDEYVKRFVERKVSMNEQNVIGQNFEKYNDCKPSQ